jgi:uncharacterized protein YjbI with pentapeptide repeats
MGLMRSDLSGADLAGANFAKADLSRALLRFAKLNGANLTGANLAGADLSGADLTGADLTGANATEADFGGAVLTNARGLGTMKGWRPRSGDSFSYCDAVPCNALAQAPSRASSATGVSQA